MTSSFSSTTAFIAANASSEEKEQFRTLWNDHLALREEGKIAYFLPHTLGTRMGAYALRDVAARLSKPLQAPVYIHFNTEKLCYRIGQVLDDADFQNIAGCVFVHKAEFPPTTNDLPTTPTASPVFQQQDYSIDEPRSIASDSGLTSSKEKAPRIPKPRNSWILYRGDKHNTVLAANPGMHTSNISTIISDMWRTESAEVRAHYKNLADQEKCNHQARYPDYKCSPRKSSEIKKRKRTSKQTVITIEGPLPGAKFARLSDKNSRRVAKDHGGDQPHAGYKNNLVTYDGQKSGGNDRLTSSSLAPLLSSSPLAIDWQPFPFDSMVSNSGAYEQPPDDLFLDSEILQQVDWETFDTMTDWQL